MAAQNAQRQFRGVKSMRELAEAPAVSAFRARFEAGRSFDLDDDLEFCPGLLTEDDVCLPPPPLGSSGFVACSPIPYRPSIRVFMGGVVGRMLY